MSYYLCSKGAIITDGAGILDVRFGEEDNPNPVFHPCKGLWRTCCVEKSTNGSILPPIPRKEGCGHRNHEGIGFRIQSHDHEAQYGRFQYDLYTFYIHIHINIFVAGEFPWTIAVLKHENVLQSSLNVYQCGGSLLHPNVVLTSAHCVYGKDPQMLRIRAGEWDTQTTDELFPHQDRNVAEIVVHEQYYSGGLFNDVALLYLTQPVELKENVNTICLPPANHNFDHSRCFASGWGKDLFSKEGKYQVILKKVELPIMPRPQCLDKLRTTRLGTHFKLHESFVCAGGEPGEDTCKGIYISFHCTPIRKKKQFHIIHLFDS